jgi:hypothetical protein
VILIGLIIRIINNFWSLTNNNNNNNIKLVSYRTNILVI